MTDEEVNFWNMSKEVRKRLLEARPQWEALYPKMVPDYTRLDTALAGLDAKLQKQTGQGSQGYTSAKDQAEVRALDAAMPIVQGIKTLYREGGYPDLAVLAKYTRAKLDDMRGSVQVAALEELHKQAGALKSELAEEMVTEDQIKQLDDEIRLYKPLLGTPREQINTGSLLREDAVAHLREARKALKSLDVRVPNLLSKLPELVAAYRKARQVVDAGHGPQDKPAQ